MPGALSKFYAALTRGGGDHVFNPWRDAAPDDVQPKTAPHQRLERLKSHLSIQPSLILIGEAPGHRGARISGLAFTCERQLIAGEIPRVTRTTRLSTNRLPLAEPSATVVWGALFEYGLSERTILWNAFPYHPHEPGKPFTNRTPNEAERRRGLEILSLLHAAFPDALVASIGNISQKSLADVVRAPVPALRHPSFGGAPQFRDGLKALAIDRGLYQPLRMSLL